MQHDLSEVGKVLATHEDSMTSVWLDAAKTFKLLEIHRARLRDGAKNGLQAILKSGPPAFGHVFLAQLGHNPLEEEA